MGLIQLRLAFDHTLYTCERKSRIWCHINQTYHVAFRDDNLAGQNSHIACKLRIECGLSIKNTAEHFILCRIISQPIANTTHARQRSSTSLMTSFGTWKTKKLTAMVCIDLSASSLCQSQWYHRTVQVSVITAYS